MPEKFNIVRQCRHGLMVFNRHDQFIGKALKVYGEYSEGEYDVFSQVVKPGDTVIEAGANLVAHTLGLAQLAGPNGRVYAFEPQRLMFQTLLGNAALNSLTNIYGFQKALSIAPGKLLVPMQDCEKEVNWGGLALGSCSEGEEVEVITIDSLKLSACDFIKVDVEGMELPVLQGAAENLRKYRPILYVENDRAEKSQELVEWIKQQGYDLYWHKPTMYNPNNYEGVKENIFTIKQQTEKGWIESNYISLNMLCLPIEAGIAMEGFEKVQ